MSATERALLGITFERQTHAQRGYDNKHDDEHSLGQLINLVNIRTGDMLHRRAPITRDNVEKAASILVAILEKMERYELRRNSFPDYDMIMVLSPRGLETVEMNHFSAAYNEGNLAADYPDYIYFYAKIGAV